jgi:integrase
MLTVKQIAALKPKAKAYTVLAEDHLYVTVQPTGTKTWVVRVTSGGKALKKTLGNVKQVSLYEARRLRDDFLQQLAQPANHASAPAEPTFAEVAEEWMNVKVVPATGKKNIDRQRRYLDNHLIPAIGALPCRMITAPHVLPLLRKSESQGHVELAHRLAMSISMILRFGVACGYAERDIIPDLRGALMPVKATHFASIHKPDEIAALLTKINALPPCSTKFGLLLCAYTFCRPGEVRGAKWSEIDFAQAEWHIPAERMKMGRPHTVPLSRQVICILNEARRHCNGSAFVLPSQRDLQKGIGPDAFRTAFRRLGYIQGTMTAHGFRSMASTALNNFGWPPDAIERQLAHVPGDKVRAAYNHAQYMPVRRKMVQWYSDYLDALLTGAPLPPVQL